MNSLPAGLSKPQLGAQAKGSIYKKNIRQDTLASEVSKVALDNDKLTQLGFLFGKMSVKWT